MTTSGNQAFPEVFIVGTGRCGSTLLSNMLRAHPDILSLSEFFMSLASRGFIYRTPSGRQFWQLLSRPSPAVRRALNPRWCPDEFLYRFGPSSAFGPRDLPPICYITLPHLTPDPDALYFELKPVIEAAPRAPLADQYRLLFEWLSARFGKTMWVERSGGSLAFLPMLVKHFPNAKFVHLFRDGRDVALSIARHPPMRLLANNWRRARAWGVDFLRPPLRLGESRVVAHLETLAAPFASGDKRLQELLEPEEIGAYWSHLIALGEETLGTLAPGQRYDLRYEDLIADPAGEAQKLIQFLDPRLQNSAWLDAVRALPSRAARPRPAIPPAQWASLSQSCAPGLALLGYRV